MLILALDTTGDFGSIALTESKETDQEVLDEVLLHAPQGFSHILFEQIEALLEQQGRRLSDVELYAAASGPGSFTGVRVGLSAMKAFAEVHQRPAVAVSNLRALCSFGTGALRAALIDARRGEVYAGLFDDDCRAVIPEQVAPLPRFLEQLPQGEIEWISSDFAPFETALQGRGPMTAAPRALSAAIARIAFREHRVSGAVGFHVPEAIDANYVRRSDAELFWKEI